MSTIANTTFIKLSTNPQATYRVSDAHNQQNLHHRQEKKQTVQVHSLSNRNNQYVSIACNNRQSLKPPRPNIGPTFYTDVIIDHSIKTSALGLGSAFKEGKEVFTQGATMAQSHVHHQDNKKQAQKGMDINRLDSFTNRFKEAYEAGNITPIVQEMLENKLKGAKVPNPSTIIKEIPSYATVDKPTMEGLIKKFGKAEVAGLTLLQLPDNKCDKNDIAATIVQLNKTPSTASIEILEEVTKDYNFTKTK